MGELTPMPHESEYDKYEKVFTPERRMETFEIEEERLETVGQIMRDDIAQIWREHGGKEVDWQGAFKKMQPKHREEYKGIQERFGKVLAVEKDLLSAFWQMWQMMVQFKLRPGLEAKRIRMVDSDNEEGRKDVEGDINELNIRSADWQAKMVNTTFALRESEKGKNMIRFLWQHFDDLASNYLSPGERREARGLKNGVRGAIAAIDIFERLGFEVYSSYPKQDALKKVDLWAKRGKMILALQIKSHDREKIAVSGEVIRHYQPTENLDELKKKEAKQKNTLLTNAREYDINWRQAGHDCIVLPYWLDLAGGFTRLHQDETGAVVDFPDDFLQSEFVKSLYQEVGGGADVH